MKIISFVVGLAAVVLCGCVEKGTRGSASAPILHLHWGGTAALNRGTNGTNLQKVLALPSTLEYRKETFAKLARMPQEVWKKSLPAGVDQSTLLAPLLDDLWTNECLIELRGSPAKPELLLAAEIDDKRAELWNTNLRQVAKGWKLGGESEVNVGSAKGWTAGKGDFTIHYARAGKWTLAAFSPGSKRPFDAMLKSPRPVPSLNATIMELQTDSRLGKLLPVLATYQIPPIDLKVSARGPSLRTEGKLRYSDRLPIRLEPWKIATNLVAEPLISFTCAQGVAPILDQIPGFSKLRLKDPPNQFCLWGLGAVHVQTYLTVPVTNPTNIVKEIAPRLPEMISVNITNPPGQFLWISNRAEWVWSGLPMVIPHLRPERAPNGDFLFAGLFPMGPRSNSAPAELLAQVIGRTNLVYYDWELTQERVMHALPLFQLYDIVNRRRPPTTNVVSQRWLREIVPYLGNSVTEVTLTSPRELSLVRKSDVGLTGFELVMLSRWLDSPGFPMDYEPPPLIITRTNRPAPPKKEP
jgi:hypothetical protein